MIKSNGKTRTVLNFAFATLTLVFAVLMIVYKSDVKPANTLEFKPVLAFEFAKTPKDIEKLFIESNGKIATAFVSKMYSLTLIDFLFIASYTSFMLCFIWLIRSDKYLVLHKFLLGLAILIGLFDVMENIQLLNILRNVAVYPKFNYQPILDRLEIYTWLKWECTGLLLFLMIPLLWRLDFWLKIMSAFNFLVFAFGIRAILTNVDCRNSAAISQFTGLIFVVLGLLIVYVIRGFILLLTKDKILRQGNPTG